MRAWEKELYNYQLIPAPPKMSAQEYITKYLAEKDEKYFSWYLLTTKNLSMKRSKGACRSMRCRGILWI